VSDALIAKEFAGYRIVSRVGRGGMGVVYRALDLSLERQVALKVLAEELADDPAFRGRFERESKLAASLDHPSVIPIYAAGEWEGVLYLAMRLVDGADLRSIVRQAGRLEPERAVRIVTQVASALDAAHAHGLVHRDVKPANVLLAAGDHVYLTDFGLSKRLAADTAYTRTGEVLGSLDSIAPEQIRREPSGPFTDVYALGCMTFQLLTGSVPFDIETEEGKLWAHLSETPRAPSELVAELGTGFDIAVRRAMSKRTEDRQPSAGVFAAALQQGLSDARTESETTFTLTPPEPPDIPASERPRIERALLALADPLNLVILAALLLTGALLGTVALTVPLSLLVYAAGVLRSYMAQ
jgi:serine/threonine protein kinase